MKKSVIKRNDGFTLVELLAVIVIMGILMMVAIPSVSAIIFDSRANAYVQSAQSYVKSAKNYVADGTIKVSAYDATYYVHINNLVDDKDIIESPFAPWNQAYVAVVKDLDNKYEFYWVSADKAGWRIDLTEFDNLDKSSVYQGDKFVNFREPIGGRNRIIIYDENGEKVEDRPFYEMTLEEAAACYSFKSTGNDIMLSYYNVDCGTDVIIPGRVDGKYVTSIHQYTFNNMGITSVYIPDTVTSIGSRAFANNKLTSLYIPGSVQNIESEAFLNNSISILQIEEGVKEIETRAFRKNKLKSAVIPNSVTTIGSCAYCDNDIPNASFLYAKNGDAFDYSTIKGYIGDLEEFKADMVFRIPSTVTDEAGNVIELKTIESNAFSRVSLQNFEVVIPDTVTVIKNSAFWDSGIAKINIPDGVTTIGSAAFFQNRLTDIVIPDSVTSIGEYAFTSNWVPDSKPEQMWIYKRTASGIDYSTIIGYAGKNRRNVNIPATANGVALKAIGANTFRELSLTGEVTIPSTVTSIGTNAFCQNRLTKINNGTTTGNGPFAFDRNADGSVNYTSIKSYGGYNTHVVVPDTVTKIADYAFYRSYITGVTLPEGLKTIGKHAFSYNYIKDQVIIPSTVTSIGSNAFYKVINWGKFNADLNTIVNKTGKEFNWQSITGGPSDANFITGTVENWYGDIEVVAE